MLETFLRRLARPLAAVALIAGGAGMAVPAPAGAQDAEGQGGQAIEVPELSDAKLESYVVAAIDVTRLIEQWQPRLQSAREAGDTEAFTSLRDQANDQLTTAVEDAEGISIEEYQAITAAARQDRELLDRIRSMMAEVAPQEG
ncbi:MAG: DUF4168 domain-containing protein [Azospirillaceae bacterium]